MVFVGGDGLSTSQTVIIIVVQSVALVVLTISICIYLRVKRRPTKKGLYISAIGSNKLMLNQNFLSRSELFLSLVQYAYVF